MLFKVFFSPPADWAHGHGAVVRPNHRGDVPEDLLVSLDIALRDHKSSNTRRFAFYDENILSWKVLGKFNMTFYRYRRAQPCRGPRSWAP